MVKLDRFEIDHWISTHRKGAKHNLANTNSPSISIQDLQSLSGSESGEDDLLTSIRSKRLDHGTSFNGIEALRMRIARLYSDNSHGSLPIENILTTPGGSLANFIVLYALVGPGDHVIVPQPTYPQLYSVPISLGAEVSLWRANKENWQFDLEELKQLIRPNTKMIIINNPQNPTGAIIPKSTLEEIIKIAVEHSLIVFSDEIYRPIFHSMSLADPELPPSILSFGYQKSVATCSLSKSYSLAGLRMGWIASLDASIVDACSNVRSYCLLTASQLDEHVAAFALDPARAAGIVERNIAQAQRNRSTVQAFIDQHSSICSWVRPVGGPIGFVQFTRSGKPIDDVALCTRLYDKKGVLLVPGSSGFGKEFMGYVRFGLGTEPVPLEAGLQAVTEFIREEYNDIPLGTKE